MAATPDSYLWLSESPLQEAGCITAVAAADSERVAAAFGCDPALATSVTYADIEGEPDRLGQGLQAWLGCSGDSAVMIEDNDYQGTRAEVLRPASKASSSGLAASIFWNVNGVIRFSAARKGKIVCSVEVLDCEPDEFPRPLRRLAALAADDETDLVALGAAMVEKFTGVAFDQTTINQASHRTLTPVPEDLETYGPEGSALRYYAPEVLAAIVAADPGTYRPLATWAAQAAAAEAGVAEEGVVRQLTEQFAESARPVLPPGFDHVLARWEREKQQWDNEHDSHTLTASSGALEGEFLQARVWAGRALKTATHPDPLEAALQATFDALWTFYCTLTKRRLTFVEDENGRHVVGDDRDGLPGRAQAFADLVLEALAQPTPRWEVLSARLPRALTDAQRQELIRTDQELQASGAFDTWQTVRAWNEDDEESGNGSAPA